MTVYLYGSRADNSKKGGDIDLVLVVEDKSVLEQVILAKPAVLAEMKSNIGDQKIDLSIITENDKCTDPFWISALNNAILL